MPITWNTEAEARLLLGILDQLKGHKLDYKALAAYMGPGVTFVEIPAQTVFTDSLGCTVPALHQRLFKLRREAALRRDPSALYLQRLPSPIKKAKNVHYVSDDDDDDTESCDVKFIKDEEDEKKVIVDLAD
ncbi:hypothetical protein BJX68DRAFT_261381 [Aspergillus pseudodeflectus]|uniref:Uncharacterized protein n=1 Tax=Aspergillus pseudodeflectus TaxID=176178 RepID=A0ABR4L7B7_9EURO